METPKNKSWNFCETPEEKCTMNYCDENGCQSRKRNLVEPKKSKAATFILGQIDKAIEKSTLEQQTEKMETLYRKVAISERLPEKGEYLTDLGIRYLDGYKNWQLSEFSKKKKVNENHEEYFEEPDFWLEEVPENKSLLKQNEELRSALQKVKNLEDIICFKDDQVGSEWLGEAEALQYMTNEITHYLEEIPNPNAQLQADKAELLEALDNSLKVIEWYMENTMPENENHTDFFNIGMNQRTEIESLIQKHKQ